MICLFILFAMGTFASRERDIDPYWVEFNSLERPKSSAQTVWWEKYTTKTSKDWWDKFTSKTSSSTPVKRFDPGNLSLSPQQALELVDDAVKLNKTITEQTQKMFGQDTPELHELVTMWFFMLVNRTRVQAWMVPSGQAKHPEAAVTDAVTSYTGQIGDTGLGTGQLDTEHADLATEQKDSDTGQAILGTEHSDLPTGQADLGTGPVHYGTEQEDLGTGPVQYGTEQADLDTGPAHDGTGQGDLDTGPAHDSTGQGDLGTGPAHDGTGQGDLGTGPAHDGTGQGDLGTGPAHDGTGQGDLDTGPAHDGTGQGDLDTGPAHEGTGQGDLDTGPAHDETAQGELGTGPAHDGTGQGDLDTGPAHDGTLQGDLDTGPAHDGTGQGDLDTGPAHDGTGQGDLGTGPAHDGTGQGDLGTGPAHDGTGQGDLSTGPANDGTGQAAIVTRPSQKSTSPADDGVWQIGFEIGPPHEGTGQAGLETGPAHDGTAQGGFETGPAHDGTAQGAFETGPKHDGAVQGGFETGPAHDGTAQGAFETGPEHDGAVQGGFETGPAHDGAAQGAFETLPEHKSSEQVAYVAGSDEATGQAGLNIWQDIVVIGQADSGPDHVQDDIMVMGSTGTLDTDVDDTTTTKDSKLKNWKPYYTFIEANKVPDLRQIRGRGKALPKKPWFPGSPYKYNHGGLRQLMFTPPQVTPGSQGQPPGLTPPQVTPGSQGQTPMNTPPYVTPDSQGQPPMYMPPQVPPGSQGQPPMYMPPHVPPDSQGQPSMYIPPQETPGSQGQPSMYIPPQVTPGSQGHPPMYMPPHVPPDSQGQPSMLTPSQVTPGSQGQQPSPQANPSFLQVSPQPPKLPFVINPWPKEESSTVTTAAPTPARTEVSTREAMGLFPQYNDLLERPDYDSMAGYIGRPAMVNEATTLMVLLGAVSSTTTTEHPLVVQLKAEMASPTSGFFFPFLKKMLELLATMEKEQAGYLFSATDIVMNNLDSAGSLRYLGLPLQPALMRVSSLLAAAPPEVAQGRAIVAYTMMTDRSVIPGEFNELLKIMDSMYHASEGAALFASLVVMQGYPENNFTSTQVMQQVITATLAPFQRQKGSQRLNTILFKLNTLIEQRFPFRRMYERAQRAGLASHSRTRTKSHWTAKRYTERTKLKGLTYKTADRYRHTTLAGKARARPTNKIDVIDFMKNKMKRMKPHGLSIETDRYYTLDKHKPHAKKSIKRIIKEHLKNKHPKLYKNLERKYKKAKEQNKKANEALFDGVFKNRFSNFRSIPIDKSIDRKKEMSKWETSEKIARKEPQTRFNIIDTVPVFNNENGKIHKNKINTDKPKPEISKYLSKYKLKTKQHKQIVEKKRAKIMGEDSISSDDEKELKFKLQDTIRHGDRKFVGRRNYKIGNKNVIHELSSYSDEEGVLKNNIYKVFGYTQRFN